MSNRRQCTKQRPDGHWKCPNVRRWPKTRDSAFDLCHTRRSNHLHDCIWFAWLNAHVRAVQVVSVCERKCEQKIISKNASQCAWDGILLEVMCDTYELNAINRCHRNAGHCELNPITFFPVQTVLTIHFRHINSIYLPFYLRETAQDWCVRWENSYTFYKSSQKEELYSFVWQFQLSMYAWMPTNKVRASEWEKEKPKQQWLDDVDFSCQIWHYECLHVWRCHHKMPQWPLYVFFSSNFDSLSFTWMCWVCMAVLALMLKPLSKQKLNRTKTSISNCTFRKKKKKKKGVMVLVVVK